MKYLSKRNRLEKNSEIIWEKITQENEKQNGGNTYGVLLDLFKGLGELLSEYNEIRVTLWSLMKKYDPVLVESMRNYGFDIDTTNSETYKQTLIRAIHQSKNYASKIKMKRNEIEHETPKDAEVKEQPSYEQLIANVTMHLGFNVPENITLALFNAYRKQIKDGRARRTDKEE